MIVMKATTGGVNVMAKTAKPFELTVTCCGDPSEMIQLDH